MIADAVQIESSELPLADVVGRIVALAPWINAYAFRQRLAFRLVGVERPVKQDDAKRRRPQDEGSLRLRCFLSRSDKSIFAALALVWTSHTEVAEGTLPSIQG